MEFDDSREDAMNRHPSNYVDNDLYSEIMFDRMIVKEMTKYLNRQKKGRN